MKITREETKFQPVVITLETQEEVDQMYALANCVSVKRDTNITFALFAALENLQGDGELYSLEDNVLVKSY